MHRYLLVENSYTGRYGNPKTERIKRVFSEKSAQDRALRLLCALSQQNHLFRIHELVAFELVDVHTG
jgi:hypothetical protein